MIPEVGGSGWETWRGEIPSVLIDRVAPRMWRVTCLAVAVAMAERVAAERQRRNWHKQRPERNRPGGGRGYDAQLADHRIGAYGEVAVAGVLQVPYRGPVDRPIRVTDVGGLHVKTSRRAGGDLIIQADEEDLSERFVLCTAEGLRGGVTIHLRGWCYGWEREGHYGDPYETGRPAYFIPQDVLRPLPDLWG